MQDTEKNSIKDKARSSAGTIPITAADLDKKPIRVRKKSKAAPEENTGDSKYKRPKVSKPESNYKQNSKLKTQNSAQLPWKRKDWQQTESEYTFGAPPKNEKIIKQRRSASKMFLNRESFGEQGELMLEALGASVKGRSEYDVTQGFHPYPGRLHPDLPKILLKQFPEGSTVFDPFMGGGTVLLEGLLWNTKFSETISILLQKWLQGNVVAGFLKKMQAVYGVLWKMYGKGLIYEVWRKKVFTAKI